MIPYKTKVDGSKNLHISRSSKPGWRALIESADQVQPFKLEGPKAYINYGSWLWCAREERYFEEPKILFHRVRKKLPRQLVGAIDEDKYVNRHSLSNLILKVGHDKSELWAVLALFNSDLANWWFLKRFGPLMEVGGFKVEGIPLPTKWAQISSKLATQAKKITAMLLRSERTPDGASKSLCKREVRAAKRKIEELLGNGFDLPAEDIKYITANFANLLDHRGNELEDLEEWREPEDSDEQGELTA